MSRNENRQFISASGTATDVLQRLAKAVYDRGGTDDDLRRIISDPAVCGQLADLIVRRDGNSLATMIAAVKFQDVNPYITEANFPLGVPVADVADMLTLTQKDLGGNGMATGAYEHAIKRKGYRPATLAEQLAYARAKWNGRDRVAALGSSWVSPDGIRNFPYLFEDALGRKLTLYWDGHGIHWNKDCLFLVVRK